MLWPLSRRKVKRLPVSNGRHKLLHSESPSQCVVECAEQQGALPRASTTQTTSMRGDWLHQISNAEVFPGGVVINGECVHPASFRYEDYSHSTRFLKAKDFGDGPRFKLSDGDWPKIKRTIPEAFLVDNEYADEYGHLLVETLSKLWPLLEGLVAKNTPILTSASASGLFPKFLALLGLQDHPLIHIDEPVRVRRLLLSSQAYVLDKGFTPKALGIYSRIRSSIPSGDSPGRIYLSRRNFPTKVGRKLLNEPEFGDVMESYGFTTVFPERLTLADQLLIYRNAKVIAGESGTAMLNRVFTEPETQEFLVGAEFGIESNHDIIRSMIGAAKNSVRVVNGRATSNDRGPNPPEWKIDLRHVREALGAMTLR